MKISHAHNLNHYPDTDRPYGIRVRLPAGDTFRALLGENWERMHWYAMADERDEALEDMASEHLYSRRGDRPRLIFEPVDRIEE